MRTTMLMYGAFVLGLSLQTLAASVDITLPDAVAECDAVCPLPDGQQPRWSDRYGQDDQVGTLNESTPETVNYHE